MSKIDNRALIMNLYFEIFNYANKCFEYYVTYDTAEQYTPIKLMYTAHRIWQHTSNGVVYIKNRNTQADVDPAEFTFIQLSSTAI